MKTDLEERYGWLLEAVPSLRDSKPYCGCDLIDPHVASPHVGSRAYCGGRGGWACHAIGYLKKRILELEEERGVED